MYLSNRDIRWAIERGILIVDPRSEAMGMGYDETAIDLHLDNIDEVKVWDIARFEEDQRVHGARGPELHLGRFDYGAFSRKYLVDPPEEARDEEARAVQLVCRRAQQIIVKPGGFLLWTTKEHVGTPSTNPNLISFVNAKSTRARTGVVVHFTAPTIHANWQGKIVLEIANHGPFHFILEENAVIAQLTVATISSPPDVTLKKGPSLTAGQRHATGEA